MTDKERESTRLQLIEGGLTKKNGNTIKALDRINRIAKDKPSNKPSLTSKQETFAKLVGYDGYTLSEAYRTAYNAENMKATTIWNEASKLTQKPNIATRIEQHAQAKQKDSWHDSRRLRAFILEKLHGIASNATPREQLKALELLGKVDFVSLFSERIENTTEIKTVSPADIESRIQELLSKTG